MCPQLSCLSPLRRTRRRAARAGPAWRAPLCPNPDHTREAYADTCACGATLKPADQPDIFAYDHIELPPIKPVTTRVHLHKGFCPCCKRRVAAKPPADMRPGSPFGPGILALVTYLHACQTFLSRRDVEPTNNQSEQALRPSVIFRKVTNGFRSAWGAKVYADICSIVGTGRRAGRSALAALRDALAHPANRVAA